MQQSVEGQSVGKATESSVMISETCFHHTPQGMQACAPLRKVLDVDAFVALGALLAPVQEGRVRGLFERLHVERTRRLFSCVRSARSSASCKNNECTFSNQLVFGLASMRSRTDSQRLSHSRVQHECPDHAHHHLDVSVDDVCQSHQSSQ